MTTGIAMKSASAHSLIIENRNKTTVSGVVDVDSFDDRCVRVYTEQGKILFRGEGLHITSLSLDTGEVSFDGTVNSLEYSSGRPRKNESALSRIFR